VGIAGTEIQSNANTVGTGPEMRGLRRSLQKAMVATNALRLARLLLLCV
jgi:hypothetical protein